MHVVFELCLCVDVAMDFEIVSTEECTPSDLSDTSRQEMYKKLETDLVSQIKMCQANRIYFKSTGDVPSTNKFQQMEEHTKKDLDSLRFAFRLLLLLVAFSSTVLNLTQWVSMNFNISPDENQTFRHIIC